MSTVSLAEKYLPEMYDSQILKTRSAKGGIYDKLVASIKNMGADALANATFDTDFFAQDLNEFGSNKEFADGEGTRATFTAMGEILGTAHGTAYGPVGNHYRGKAGEDPKCIDDDSKAKYVFALSEPSFGTKAIKNVFHNQAATVRDMMDRMSVADQERGEPYGVRDVVKDLPGKRLSLLFTSDLPIYSNPRGKLESGSGKKALKKRAIEVDEDDEVRPSLDALGTSMPEEELPDESAITKESKYSPRVFRNYGGELFKQQYALVNQPEFYTLDGKLIAPWRMAHELRPGTLVIVTVSIVAWAQKWNPNSNDQRRIYQLLIHEMRVAAVSDVPVTYPSPTLSLEGVGAKTRPIVTLKKTSAFRMIDDLIVQGASMAKPSSSSVASTSSISSSSTPSKSSHAATSSSVEHEQMDIDEECSPTSSTSSSATASSSGANIGRKKPKTK
ncbi:hypothetical protein V5O48_008924 [Marasmius crinis-equi]|uniref:Uncharacterized protein n=1 Tax=Marasmius crinis-equi TaxID=585013 RepID=A0ABR3FCJ5_9AGAR